MHAAVVRSFDAPPRYETFQTPEPSNEHEIAVDVLAAGLHPRVRSGASGSHYTSTDGNYLPRRRGQPGAGVGSHGWPAASWASTASGRWSCLRAVEM